MCFCVSVPVATLPTCQPTGTVLCREGCKLHATVAASSHPFLLQLLRVFLSILILNFENLESARVVPQFRLDAIKLTVAFDQHLHSYCEIHIDNNAL